MAADKPKDVDPGVRLSLGEINALVASYFDEAGLSHSAFTLRQESRLEDIKLDGGISLSDVPIPPGQLVRVLMKGLLYLEAEARWRGEDVMDDPPRLMGTALTAVAPFKPIPRDPPSAISPPLVSPVESGPRSPYEARARSKTKTPRASPPIDMKESDQNTAESEPTPIASTSKVPIDGLPSESNGFSANMPLDPLPENRSQLASTSATKRKDRTSLEPSDVMDVDSESMARAVSNSDSEVSREIKRPRTDLMLDAPPTDIASIGEPAPGEHPSQSTAALSKRSSSATATGKRSIDTGSKLEGTAVPIPEHPVSGEGRVSGQNHSRTLTSKGLDEAKRGSSLSTPASMQSLATMGPGRSRSSATPAISVSVKTITTTVASLAPPVASPVASAPPSMNSVNASATGNVTRRSASPISMRRVRSRSPSAPKNALLPESQPVTVKSKGKSSDRGKTAASTHRAVTPNGTEREEMPRGPDPALVVPASAVARFSGAPPKYCSSPCAFNNNLLATGSNDSQMRIYEVPTTGGEALIEEHANGKHAAGAKKIEIPCAAWNCHGTLLATGSEDGVVRCWTIGGELSGVLTMHQGSVWTLKWHPDGTRLLTGSHDYSVILWDAGTTHMKQNWTTHTDRVMCVDWIDEQYWASCSRDGQVHIMSVGRNAPVARLRGHSDDVNFIRIDPTRSLLASCSSDDTVRIWSLIGLAGPRATDTYADDEDNELPELERRGGSIILRGHTGEVHQIAWQPGAGIRGKKRLLASVSSDSTGRVWDVDNGTCLYLLDRHVHEVYSLCFRPTNGDTLALGSNDGRVSFWSMKDGREIAEYTHSPDSVEGGDRRVYEVVWHPRRDQVAVTGTGTAVLLLDGLL